jgi:predicted acetyltransferase
MSCVPSFGWGVSKVIVLLADERAGRLSAVGEVEIVHPIDVAEASAWFAAMHTTFLLSPVPDDPDLAGERRRRGWPTLRHWGARADGRWVGTLATMTRQLTVPGARGSTQQVAADALTMVTVAGTHRRQGLLRRMLSDSLAEARERGDLVAILFAAEWGIYGRFGYAPASFAATYELDPRRAGASVPSPTDRRGTVRQVEPTELGAVAPALFETARRDRAGNIDRDAQWWERVLGLNGLSSPMKAHGRVPNFYVHETAGTADGYVGWVGTADMDSDSDAGTIDVAHLSAMTPAAYRGLWSYLTNLDLVDRIRLFGRPVDEPVRWLLGDGRALRQTSMADGLWLRLLDLPAALAARRYAVDDELTFEVVDDDGGGYAAGRVTLTGGRDGAECRPARGRSADLRLGQRVLASTYLGGASLRAQFGAGHIDELTPGAVDRADAMFRTTLAPWCATDF